MFPSPIQTHAAYPPRLQPGVFALPAPSQRPTWGISRCVHPPFPQACSFPSPDCWPAHSAPATPPQLLPTHMAPNPPFTALTYHQPTSPKSSPPYPRFMNPRHYFPTQLHPGCNKRTLASSSKPSQNRSRGFSFECLERARLVGLGT